MEILILISLVSFGVGSAGLAIALTLVGESRRATRAVVDAAGKLSEETAKASQGMQAIDIKVSDHDARLAGIETRLRGPR